MAADRAHFPQAGEVERTIDRMVAEHQTLCGWLETMSEEELERARTEIRRMFLILSNESFRRMGGGDE